MSGMLWLITPTKDMECAAPLTESRFGSLVSYLLKEIHSANTNLTIRSIKGGYDAEKAKGEEYHGTYFIANNTWAIGQLPDYIWECSSVYVPETKKVLIVYGFAPEWMYDPATNSFNTSFSDIFIGNTRDMAAGSALYDGKLWLAGSGQDNTVFRTVTTDGLTWDVKTSNPNGFVFMDMVKLGDAMLTFGGTNMSDESAAGYDLINMYNLTSDAWTTLAVGLPLPLNGVSTKLVGPSLYLFGGLYYNGDTAVFNDKYWIVPCVDPTVCENGCNATTGACNPVLPPSSTPSAPSGSAAPSSTSPAATPKSKTSSASFYNTITIGGLLFAILVLLI